MIVNIGLIIFFGLLLRFEKKTLNVFGFLPLPKRFYQLLLGFSLTAVLSILVNVLFGYSAHFSWVQNEHYNAYGLFTAVYKTFNSVVFEELIFRGYLLYKLLDVLGEKWAVIITSSLFGVYHWFTFEILGNYSAMIWIFFTTGLWGLMFAYAYTRTGTLLLAIGLHWGWNFLDQIMFNKNGDGVLRPLTSDQTVFLNQSGGFLVTTLPTITFSLLVILYLLNTKKVQIKDK